MAIELLLWPLGGVACLCVVMVLFVLSEGTAHIHKMKAPQWYKDSQ